MSHVPTAVLRRMQDEPLATPDEALRHLAGCARCQAARRDSEASAAFAAARLASPPDPAPDLDAQWRALTARLRQPAPAPNPATDRPSARVPRRLPRRLAAASISTGTAITAGVLVVGVAAAAALTTVYAPTHVVPVRVPSSSLNAFQEITGLGTGLIGGSFPDKPVSLPFGQATWHPSGHAHRVASVTVAQAETRLARIAPTALPQGTGRVREVVVQPEVTATLKFSAGAGHGVGGSTLTVRGGPAVLVEYGAAPGAPAPDTLAVITMRRPVATSTGASAEQLEDFLLAQPGIPPVLAQEIRLLGQSALPVPVPSGVTEHHLTLGGSPAVLLTGPAGAASGVIWESGDGVVHAVAGLVTSEDILNVARQLS